MFFTMRGMQNLKCFFYLAIWDLNPSNETCIYSTLLYIEKQALQLDISIPCVIFDQPLWIKAIEIIKSKSLKIACQLGGFYTMMSFVGSIGSVMKSSGLEEALEATYGPNVVMQMMSGKAILRDLCSHFWWKVHYSQQVDIRLITL